MDKWELITDYKIKNRIYKIRKKIGRNKITPIFLVLIFVVGVVFMYLLMPVKQLMNSFIVMMVLFAFLQLFILKLQRDIIMKNKWMDNNLYKVEGTFIEEIQSGHFNLVRIEPDVGDDDIICILVSQWQCLVKGTKMVVFYLDTAELEDENDFKNKIAFTYEEYQEMNLGLS